MPRRVVRITARSAFLFCGLISLFTAVPYVMLRGIDLPVQSEWVIFVVALTLVGASSVTFSVLPRSWIAKACRKVWEKDRDDERLFSTPLKVLGGMAVIFYLVAVAVYFTPNSWNFDPQLMFALCPMYFVKMTFDPSPLMIFLLLAPMNAAVYGARLASPQDMLGWPSMHAVQVRGAETNARRRTPQPSSSITEYVLAPLDFLSYKIHSNGKANRCS